MEKIYTESQANFQQPHKLIGIEKGWIGNEWVNVLLANIYQISLKTTKILWKEIYTSSSYKIKTNYE